MSTLSKLAGIFVIAILAVGQGTAARSQDLPAGMTDLPTKEDFAKDNNLVLTFARKVLKWDEPAEPIKIVGPLYFVGTEGLSSWLFVTSEGLISASCVGSFGPSRSPARRYAGIAESPKRRATSPSAPRSPTVIASSASVMMLHSSRSRGSAQVKVRLALSRSAGNRASTHSASRGVRR